MSDEEELTAIHCFSSTVDSPDELLNFFKVVHLSNRSDVYHLTRQVLIDSMITQDTYCFFYHILSKSIDDFNKLYGSFACLIAQSDDEADLYLNVNVSALNYIINYIQTTKINIDRIKSDNEETVEEMIDLATMFGMPNLVSILRQSQTSKSPESRFRELISTDEKLGELLAILWEVYAKN